MKLAEVAKVLQILETIGRLEVTMAEFYATCAEVWTADSSFWQGLQVEEHQHSQNIEKMAAIITRRQDHFELNRAFNPTAINTFIAYVTSMIQRVREQREPRLEPAQVLAMARDMEQSIIEGKYNEIVKTNDAEYLRMTRGILADTLVHRNKIADRLVAVSKTH
ncbi:MAG TPA: hypothetical protein VLM91_17400 [Candidatus Methylomirabilis sp.]|nr:hypothetical protein [Candidatus Methylomirabilis sp.]